MEDRSSDVIIIAIILGLLIALGIPKRLAIFYDAASYYGVCIIKGNSKQVCLEEAKEIASLAKDVKAFKGLPKEDKEILTKVRQEVAPYQGIILFLLFLILVGKYNVKYYKEKRSPVKEVPELFDGEEQKVVKNFYALGGKLTEKDINTMSKALQPLVRLALFCLIAKEKMNFPAGELAEGIKNETARKIIFSVGRPAIPKSVSAYYYVASSILEGEKEKKRD